jgi:hypothetical protein
MVIAANGNDQSANPIPQPAVAPTALGVAEFCIANQAFSEKNNRPDAGRPGKAGSGRAGTIWTAASNTSDTADVAMHPYPGTSGATPTVAAAALVLRNWLKGSGDAVDPGQVYAALIVCGQNTRVDPVQGAGLVQLPDRAELLWASATLQGGDSLEIQIPKGNSWSQLDAAIWWPELDTSDGGGPALSRRAWIALRLDDPERKAFARSDVPGSVFQRASLHTSDAGRGTWFLTLLGNSIPEGQTRTVFWAVRGGK